MSRDLINNMLGFSGFDGDRISMKGHPVFIAQHATATCCRGLYSEVASDKERKGAFRSGDTVSRRIDHGMD